MGLRYLFGPASAAFAAEHLSGLRQAGECLVFDTAGGVDLVVQPDDTWEDLGARLPAGWQPDFVALVLAQTNFPAALWQAPVPLVGLAVDSNLFWHYYRRILPRCDLVLTDSTSAERMRQAGLEQARVANLFGLGRSFLELIRHDTVKDLDLVFAGNFHPAVQRERLAWLGRLARLADRWRVALRTAVYGEEYRALLARARIVFNRSIRGECNMRALEATAAGALLFQEAGNREMPTLFREGEEYVVYHDADLESLLEYYLNHEEERRRIAEAGRRRAQNCGYEQLWAAALTAVEAEWSQLQESARKRFGIARASTPSSRAGPERQPSSVEDLQEDLLTRTWHALSVPALDDPRLAAQLEAALLEQPFSATLRNLQALLTASMGAAAGPMAAEKVNAAARHFAQALICDPENLVLALNLVEALALTGHTQQAAEEARRALALLDRDRPPVAEVLNTPRFPPGFDLFRVEWERAAWDHPGSPDAEAQAKTLLLRWRFHTLLGELTEQREHLQEAARLRPELGPTQAALGCALGRAGRADLAVAPLSQALALSPFDVPAARALCQALRETGDIVGQDRLAREYRRLAQVAPQLVSLEPWFAEAASTASFPPPQDAANRRQDLFRLLSREEFHQRFGQVDTTRAICAFTPPHDTNVVVTLLAQARPRRILEIGTAAGHMTANLAEWSPAEAIIYSIGTVADLTATGAPEQRGEEPERAVFGCFANHFGKVHKVCFITADSLDYDFRRLAPLDFAFIDGAHDLAHVLSDSRKVYDVLAPGGCIVWHDFNSTVPWVEVRAALEQAGFTETVYHVAGTEVAYLHKQGGQIPLEQRERFGIVWEGLQLAQMSYAVVNRELCRRLLERGHDVAILSVDARDALNVPLLSAVPALAERFHRPLSRPADVNVRHFWPPTFTSPPAGHLVLMQPWEYGSLPRAWIRPILEQVDEVWAYTDFVRDCYLQSGIPAERVHVVPLGVDPARFHPQAQPLRLQTTKRFKFLFVGGTIARKGFDVLLEAYVRTFTAASSRTRSATCPPAWGRWPTSWTKSSSPTPAPPTAPRRSPPASAPR